jgi:hypothetical protein
MYPPSIDMKHTLRDDVKREYHQVQLTQGWPDSESQQKQQMVDSGLNFP